MRDVHIHFSWVLKETWKFSVLNIVSMLNMKNVNDLSLVWGFSCLVQQISRVPS